MFCQQAKTSEAGSGKFVFDEKQIIVDHIDFECETLDFVVSERRMTFILQSVNIFNMQNEWDKRFSGTLGEEYNLFKLSVPHHDEFQDKITEILAAFSPSNKMLEVLEGGTGTGLTTFRILNAKDNIRVTTIDNEEKTLNQAKEILKEKGDKIKFVNDDLLKFLKLCPDNQFDAFVSAYVIHNLKPDYRLELFKEISRVLKTGGIFINADKYAYDDKKLQNEALQNQIKAFGVYEQIGRPDVKEEWTRHYYEDEEIKITENEQKEILQNLGFSEIQIVYRKGMESIITAYKQGRES